MRLLRMLGHFSSKSPSNLIITFLGNASPNDLFSSLDILRQGELLGNEGYAPVFAVANRISLVTVNAGTVTFHEMLTAAGTTLFVFEHREGFLPSAGVLLHNVVELTALFTFHFSDDGTLRVTVFGSYFNITGGFGAKLTLTDFAELLQEG